MKWRFVHVNKTIPSASFYTIQMEDYSVFPYYKDSQKDFKRLIETEKFRLGKIGDAYTKWRYEQLPTFLTKELFRNPMLIKD